MSVRSIIKAELAVVLAVIWKCTIEPGAVQGLECSSRMVCRKTLNIDAPLWTQQILQVRRSDSHNSTTLSVSKMWVIRKRCNCPSDRFSGISFLSYSQNIYSSFVSFFKIFYCYVLVHICTFYFYIPPLLYLALLSAILHYILLLNCFIWQCQVDSLRYTSFKFHLYTLLNTSTVLKSTTFYSTVVHYYVLSRVE